MSEIWEAPSVPDSNPQQSCCVNRLMSVPSCVPHGHCPSPGPGPSFLTWVWPEPHNSLSAADPVPSGPSLSGVPIPAPDGLSYAAVPVPAPGGPSHMVVPVPVPRVHSTHRPDPGLPAHPPLHPLSGPGATIPATPPGPAGPVLCLALCQDVPPSSTCNQLLPALWALCVRCAVMKVPELLICPH